MADPQHIAALLGQRPSPRDLERLVGVHPRLVTIICTVITELPMFVVMGVRTAEQQHVLWLQHPRVTWKDGYVHRSNHQTHADGLGYAVDCAWLGGDPFALTHDWSAYGAAVKAAGCVWGGDFKTLVDLDHAELPDLA